MARISALIAGEITIEVATPDEISVRAYGPATAIATGRSTIAPATYRWTAVYVRRDGVWQVGASHASPASR